MLRNLTVLKITDSEVPLGLNKPIKCLRMQKEHGRNFIDCLHSFITLLKGYSDLSQKENIGINGKIVIG